jgi:biofilm protein TabA
MRFLIALPPGAFASWSMIYGHLSHRGTYAFLLHHPVWKMSFDWLQTINQATPLGTHKIQGDQVYASVQRYETLPREKCRYESHRRYIDIQYCIDGGEIIDHSLTSDLPFDGDYQEAKEAQLYGPYEKGTPLVMSPGWFCVFFPPDGHQPKRRDGIHADVFKVVIKIEVELVM